MMEKLKINDEFKNKLECFHCFRELIGKDVFELIDCYPNEVPLDRVNKLIPKDYVRVKIIEKEQHV